VRNVRGGHPVRINKGKMDGKILRELKEIRRRFDILIVIELASRGLELKEIANILNVSERTIQRIISVRKIKKQGGKGEKEM